MKNSVSAAGTKNAGQERFSEQMRRAEAENELASLLRGIEQAERVSEYPIRNQQVYQAAGLAARLGYEVGVKLDPDEPLWPVIFIELPTGQVSWHLPMFPHSWDGHDTRTKYARCRAYSAPRGYTG